MSTPIRLPPALMAKVHASQREHIMKLVNILMRHYPEGSKTCKPEALVEDLQSLTNGDIVDIAQASYEQGLATAGDARQAIDDLATLRAAACILTGAR